MAEFLFKNQYSLTGMPKSMQRSNPTPLDSSAVWTKMEDLIAYAKGTYVDEKGVAVGRTSYVGQILSLVEYDANTKLPTSVKAYIIKDKEGNIEEVGSATLGDDKGITLANGVLSLKNWGVEYYKWIDPVGEEGEDGYVAGHHEKQIVDENNPWIAGLEPKATTASDGTIEIAWYQPSTVTLQGVSSAITSVQTTVSELSAGIGSREDEAGAETVYGAINKVEEDNAANADAIKALEESQANYLPLAGGALTGELTLSDNSKAASESVVDSKIATAIGSAGHLKREIVTSLPAVEDADVDTIYMVKDALATSGDVYEEYMVIEGAWAQIGDTSVDLTNYLQKVTGAVAGNLGSLDANGVLVDSGVGAQSVADHLINTEVHITAQERIDWNAAKTTADQAASDIAALVKISQDDADKLAALPGIKSIGANLVLGEDGALSAVAEQYELPAATADTLGGVKVSDAGLAIDTEGALSVKVSATGANGLVKATDGLGISLASETAAGAMSAEHFAKLSNIAAGAQVNTVEGVLLDGIAATIDENKFVVIPTASASAAGLVYGSSANNGVAVDADGLMTVNNLATSKLYVPEGEEFVLDCGSAQI